MPSESCENLQVIRKTYEKLVFGWELALKKKNYKNEANVATNNTRMDFTQKKYAELLEAVGSGDYRLMRNLTKQSSLALCLLSEASNFLLI